MMATFRDKYIKKYGKDAIGGLDKISQVTKVPLNILQQIFNRGVGAARTNPESIRLKGTFKKDPKAPRSKKLSDEQWGMARVYGFIGGNKKQIDTGKPDSDLWNQLTPYRRNKLKNKN